MAKRRGSGRAAARRRTAGRRSAVAVAVVVVGAAVFRDRLWPLLAALAAAGAVAGCGWWAWRRHRALRAADARWRRQDRLAAGHRTVAEVDGMGGTDFEELTAGLLRRDGCTEVARTGGSGDRGVDVLGRLPDGRLLVVQCKRWAPGRAVGSPEIIRLVGSQRHYEADAAMIVTTSRLTRNAVQDAERHGILTVHRDHLGHWLGGAPLASLIAVSTSGQGDRDHLRRWNRTYGARRRRPGAAG